MEPYPLSGASCVILVVAAFLARLLDDYSIIILQRTFSRVRKIKPIYIFSLSQLYLKVQRAHSFLF